MDWNSVLEHKLSLQRTLVGRFTGRAVGGGSALDNIDDMDDCIKSVVSWHEWGVVDAFWQTKLFLAIFCWHCSRSFYPIDPG